MRHSTSHYLASINEPNRLLRLGLGLGGGLILLLTCFPAYGQQIQTVVSADLSLGQKSETIEAAEAASVHYGMPELRRRMPEFVYPVQAEEFMIEGRVIVEFMLNEKGKVKDPQIVNSLGYGCDEEVLRVLRRGRFKPVLDQEGQPRPTEFIVAFDFQLDEQ